MAAKRKKKVKWVTIVTTGRNVYLYQRARGKNVRLRNPNKLVRIRVPVTEVSKFKKVRGSVASTARRRNATTAQVARPGYEGSIWRATFLGFDFS